MDDLLQRALKAYSDLDPQAFPLLLRCAERGDPIAVFLVAVMYADGESVAADEVKFDFWKHRLIELAESGNAIAQWELSCNYRFGNYFPLDINLANYWLEQAAENEVPEAQFHLGLYLRRGDYNYPSDEESSNTWIAYAVANGHPEAMYYQALNLFDTGKPTDAAIALLREASTKGFTPAKEVLDAHRLNH